MRLCALDEIKVCIDRQYENCHGYSGSKKAIYREAILAVKSILHSAKPIDAVEVVRCKECKYFLQYSEKYKQEVECADGDCFIKCLHSEEVQYCSCKNDDYCSFGERRDSND